MCRFVTKFTYSLILLSMIPAFAQPAAQIEPKAGTWKTWAISSGKDFRVPPPPDATATRREVEGVARFIAEKDPRIADQVTFWDAGAPAYRWNDLIWNRIQSG